MKNYRIVPVQDKRENTFEAYELVCGERHLFIDVRAAEAIGGIEKLREGIVPYHMIVCETLI